MKRISLVLVILIVLLAIVPISYADINTPKGLIKESQTEQSMLSKIFYFIVKIILSIILWRVSMLTIKHTYKKYIIKYKNKEV